MEPMPAGYDDRGDNPQERKVECQHCFEPCEEGDMYCANCADDKGVCMVCGGGLERMTREEYTAFPVCSEHN